MGEGNAASASRQSSSSCRRGPGGCGLALGRLVRRLRRRSKMMLCTAARPAAASQCCHQYDPLSYARNFDRDGFGTGLDSDDGDVSGHFSHHYTFASRFVLASSSGARQPQ